MKRHARRWSVLPVAVAGLAISASSSTAWADDEELPFAVGKIFFQLNDTDGDLGIHGKIDGDAWKKLVIEDPRERKMLGINLSGRLRRQGLTEISFESAEPTFDVLAPSTFFRRFPEGEYEIEGKTLAGDELESEVMVTHVIPAPPENLQVAGMDVPEDCGDTAAPTIFDPVVISWDEVTESHPEIGEPGPVEIVRYELAVEREEPAGLSITFDLPPEVTEIQIPSEIVSADDEFKFQVLATDVGGNETSSESCFVIGSD